MECHIMKVFRDSTTQLLLANLESRRRKQVRNRNAASAEAADQRHVNMEKTNITSKNYFYDQNKLCDAKYLN